MNSTGFDEVLLLPATMEAGRLAIIAKYKTFQHLTERASIHSIRKFGLLPSRDAMPPDYVVGRFGANAGKVICLHPVGSTQFEPKGTKHPPFIKLAIDAEAVPRRISLDWTYNWSPTDKIRLLNPDLDHAAVLVKAVEDRGSLLIYDRIEPEVLRVCCRNSGNDRTLWPQLVDVADDEVALFDEGLNRMANWCSG